MRSNLAVIRGRHRGGLVLQFCGPCAFRSLVGVQFAHPPLTLAAAIVLIVAAILASLLPAYRASRVEPSLALRAE